LMTSLADRQRLSLPGAHDSHPGRFVFPSRLVQVGKLADVVDLDWDSFDTA
jgi:hypothetical protein